MKSQSNKSKLPVGYTVQGIVDKAGGSGRVGRECGVSVQSVNKWKYIPGWHAEKVAILAGLPLAIVRPDHVA